MLLLLATFVVWPLARVLWLSIEGPAGLTLSHYQAFFGSWRLARILVDSLVVAAVSTALTVLVALVLAYAVTRTTMAGRRLVSLTAVLPLISPPFLASLALILLFGRSIEGFAGIVAAQVFTFLPRAYIVLASVLGAMDVALEEAAESLGAGPLTTLRRVTLVGARPGLASAALVVFILCVTDFGNPILIGGRYRVLTTEIYSQVSGMKDVASASTMSVILVVPCLLAWVVNMAGVGARSSVTLPAGARASRRPTPAALRWPLTLLAGSIALLVASVYGLVPLGSLVRLWGGDWSLSLRHYAVASTAEGAWPIWNSVRLAAAAGVLGTVLALVTACVVERKRPPGSRLLESLSLLPAALPGTVVGVGYVLAFNEPPLLLTGTVWILV
ncbi:MAG TPA: ABC transporter permease subunit, partial [Methylomirabilota bacterium]|nr:ABC transporter permease subunit [Methylomirabilota bacterium]